MFFRAALAILALLESRLLALDLEAIIAHLGHFPNGSAAAMEKDALVPAALSFKVRGALRHHTMTMQYFAHTGSSLKNVRAPRRMALLLIGDRCISFLCGFCKCYVCICMCFPCISPSDFFYVLPPKWGIIDCSHENPCLRDRIEYTLI